MFSCGQCSYQSKRRYDVKRHENALHMNMNMSRRIEQEYPVSIDGFSSLPLTDASFDIRLKENFKLFVSGPSRCGKTVFVAKLIENIGHMAKKPPRMIIYVYKVWQDKYDEMKSLGVNFILDNCDIVNDIKAAAQGDPLLVIFDDLIGSKSLEEIASLFTVDARHLNISLVFLTQRLFVNNEHFRQISQNSDYFCLFKNPRNSSEIRALAQQMTPGNLVLVDIYREATEKPFSYLFINLTQECDLRVRFLSDLFSGSVKVFIQEGKGFKKMVGKGNFSNLLLNGNVIKNLTFQEFRQNLNGNNSNFITPKQQMQNQNLYLQTLQNDNLRCLPCQHEDFHEIGRAHV